jgi:hypothetical protein
MSVVQTGQVDARSQVPRGLFAVTSGDVRASVLGAGATVAALPGARGMNTDGGSVPRGNRSRSMTPRTSSRV